MNKVLKWFAKQSFGSLVFDAFNTAFILVLFFIMLYPFVYVISVSVSDSEMVSRGFVKLFPKGFDLEAYKVVIRNADLVLSYWNTIKYTAVGTVMILLFGCLAAYPLSRKELYGRNTITFILSLTMIIPGGMIPNYLLIRNLHLIDSMWAIVLPPIFSIWNIILLRTNFQSIPDDLIASARIDGSSEWRTLFQIVIPLSKPILATIALFAAVSHWNSFFHALLYLNSPSKFPLQILLRKVIMSEVENVEFTQALGLKGGKMGAGFIEKIKMATVFVAIGPIIAIYPFVQKYFIKGTMIGAIKS